MAKTIDQLIREADDIIEKRASVKVASVASGDSDDSIEKMASALLSHTPAVQPNTESAVKTPFEKVAQALVIVETLMNIDTLSQLGEFEKMAHERGYSEDQIASYMDKIAVKMDYKRVLPLIPALGAAGVAGAGGAYLGHRHGKAKGSKEGYAQAIKDVDAAMKDYQL